MKKVILLGAALVLVAAGCSQLGSNNTAKMLTIEEAQAKAIDFINSNLMQPGSTVTVKEAGEDQGMYKLVLSLSTGQEVTSYITKDGTKFFPQVMDVAEIESQANEQADATPSDSQPQPATNVPKAERAKVELFVMSHCPYGTQIEKGILPVLDTLGDQVDFELKFCDYAMHGEKELKEELNQYCIEKNEPEKLTAYLQCFLADGDGEGCLSTTGINTTKMNSCVAATDSQYKVMENYQNQVGFRGSYPGFDIFKADTDAYGVSGSPTLVINGQIVSSGRDSASLLASICNGYDNPPDVCTTQLSSAQPSAGFGFNTSAASTNADCGG